MTYLKNLIVLAILITPFAAAASLSEIVISAGPHAGEKLSAVVRSHHVPERAIVDAFRFYDLYKDTSRTFKQFRLVEIERAPKMMGFIGQVVERTEPRIANHHHMVIFDLNLPAVKPRLHLINLLTGDVTTLLAAHGLESECGGKKPGYACRFISDRESKASPLGFFTTDSPYFGKKGTTIGLNGLEARSPVFEGNDVPSTIVIHSAKYVRPGHVGHSWGCPAMQAKDLEKVRDQISDGALFYFFHSSLPKN